MSELAKEVLPVKIEDEMKQSYLDYAMSVIVGRALPDVRDGLKPVHRRVLFAMHELSNDWNKPYKKSARVVGDVIGKYHPHGDTAVYDTMVRMAQPFSMRYMIIDGQGNFGSVDGDSPAAMRYTEVRMSRFAHSLLADLDKDTVDFAPNYDETEHAPIVLPTRIPNLLVNGSSGIAVGMATNIPPHNLKEVINGCLALIDNPAINLEGLMQHIPGPDFPTAGIINGRAGIVDAYRTGRGRVIVRARTEIESDEKTGKSSIIVKELPYQVNKARLIEKIAELVKEKKVEGVTGLRDESDKDGMRVVIELRRSENAEILLNQLYLHTQLQSVFGINMVALVDGRPQTLSLKQLLEAFLRHRREVVTRRSLFELNKAKARAHVLEGLGIALANIDEMIALIKAAASPAQAKEQILGKVWKAGAVNDMLARAQADSRPDGLDKELGLSAQGYRLSEVQAQAILDLRLHRLTGLEQDKIFEEYQNLLKLIAELLQILGDPDKLIAVIRQELEEVKQQFGDDRRTEILGSQQDLEIEDLIEEAQVVVTLSRAGYAKYQPLNTYSAQRRGGRGKAATAVKNEDVVSQMIIASTHDTLLCFSSSGKVYWLKVYQLPQAGRTSRGKPIINILPLAENETISAMLPIKEYNADHFVVMATSGGTIKKTSLQEFSRPRNSGIIAIDLKEKENLIGAAITDGQQEIMLFTTDGKAVRFHESDVRAMGRTAAGVRGAKLAEEADVISLIIPDKEGQILTATENGYGKRTKGEEYPQRSRGTQGVISIQTTERNGKVVAAIQVKDGEELVLISDQGTLVRIRADDVSLVGRNTQGVRLINLAGEEKLAMVQRVDDEEGEESAEGG
jgi:DNA gyrase subunit A